MMSVLTSVARTLPGWTRHGLTPWYGAAEARAPRAAGDRPGTGPGPAPERLSNPRCVTQTSSAAAREPAGHDVSAATRPAAPSDDTAQARNPWPTVSQVRTWPRTGSASPQV